MERNDEEHLGMEQPVVAVGAGQKVAGGILRGFGLLIFLPGAIGLFLGMGASVFRSRGSVDWDFYLGLGITMAVTGFIMVTGTLMGAFGVVVSRAVGTASSVLMHYSHT